METNSEAGRSFPTLMTAASRLEALAASCASNKKAHTFLRLAGEHNMTAAEAETLFERTMQPRLPSYMKTTLSSIADAKDGAETRDALRFAQSLAAFKSALEEHQQSQDPMITIFKNLHSEWAKLLPACHKATTAPRAFEVRTSTPAISATPEPNSSAYPKPPSEPPSDHAASPNEASN